MRPYVEALGRLVLQGKDFLKVFEQQNKIPEISIRNLKPLQPYSTEWCFGIALTAKTNRPDMSLFVSDLVGSDSVPNTENYEQTHVPQKGIRMYMRTTQQKADTQASVAVRDPLTGEEKITEYPVKEVLVKPI